MSLRAKLVLAIVAITTVATAAIGAFAYRATATRLHEEVERSVRDGVQQLSASLDGEPRRGGPFPEGSDRYVVRPRGLEDVVVQVVGPTGAPLLSGDVTLPIDDAVRDTAAAGASQPPSRNDGFERRGREQPSASPAAQAMSQQEVQVGGETYLVVTAPVPGVGAVQVARSLAEAERILQSLRLAILAAAAAVIALAAAVGWFTTGQLTRRLEHLTEVAAEVEATGRLDIEVPRDGADETAKLGAAFAAMLAALARSREEQARLVQDAGHELRTPITSLRTNVGVLQRYDDLPEETRRRVLDDLATESTELTDLVNELVELATDPRDEPITDVDLAALARQVATRAERRTGRVIEVRADDSIVRGRAGGVERAMANLVDNACKFSDPDSGSVELTVEHGLVEVCDRGPGIDTEDMARVFDRFFRASSARSRPGSGLGLAIVRDVAEDHGGHAFVRPREGGGVCVGFDLPMHA